MQKLVIALLGAAALGLISMAGNRLRRRRGQQTKEDLSRWESEGGSVISNPDQSKGRIHGEAILDG
jgi:hypothetical protein